MNGSFGKEEEAEEFHEKGRKNLSEFEIHHAYTHAPQLNILFNLTPPQTKQNP